MLAIFAQVDVCVHHSLTDTIVCTVLSKIAMKMVASLAFCSAANWQSLKIYKFHLILLLLFVLSHYLLKGLKHKLLLCA